MDIEERKHLSVGTFGTVCHPVSFPRSHGELLACEAREFFFVEVLTSSTSHKLLMCH